MTTATSTGGVTRHMLDLAISLRERRWKPLVVAPNGATELSMRATALGLSVASLEERNALSSDLLHLHLHDTFDRRATALLLRRGQGPVVCTEHLPRTNASDPSLLAQYRRRPLAGPAKLLIKRLQATRCDRIIAVSNGSSRFLSGRFGLRAPQVRVVNNGIALPQHWSEPLASPELRVVCLGSMIRQKGQDVLIEAAGHAVEPWIADIYGEGPAREALERSARTHRQPRVTIHGWYEEPLAVIRAADVVCLPSRWESSPYVALEAMSEARAVVASRVDGLEEIVISGQTGLLVEPDDPVSLAAALDSLAADRATCTAMGRAGRARVAQHYALDAMVTSTIAVYEEALEVSGSR